MDLSEISDVELVGLYPKLLKELKKREIIRTNNLVGELGKFVVMNSFWGKPELPTLFPAPNSQKNYSFQDDNGARYNVKTTSGNNTGVFHSVPLQEDSEQSFEFLIVLKFSKGYEPVLGFICDWQQFVTYRQIKKPEGKWYLQLSPEFINSAKCFEPITV